MRSVGRDIGFPGRHAAFSVSIVISNVVHGSGSCCVYTFHAGLTERERRPEG
jgi:hypothetical protein